MTFTFRFNIQINYLFSADWHSVELAILRGRFEFFNPNRA
ncbi:Uncharacterized protein dnm_068970 [Desulfonema magnum]|uniref:Uncharacterized protein n=1 Tax=Desulfonema magnum TaxID=45655 RepID=A0A975BTF8_9BACT|nr:Uncharacterized protein dnm_068970 [Desulfonema magnum]